MKMNRNAEETAREELEHKSAMHAMERAKELINLRGQMVPMIDDLAEEEEHSRSRLAPGRGNTTRLMRSRERAAELNVQDRLDGLILPRGSTAEQMRELDKLVVDAYAGAVTAVARANRAQRRGQPVEHIFLLDDELP